MPRKQFTEHTVLSLGAIADSMRKSAAAIDVIVDSMKAMEIERIETTHQSELERGLRAVDGWVASMGPGLRAAADKKRAGNGA